MLSAFGKFIETSHPAIYKRIGRLLTNPDESDLLFFKLIPTTKYGDRDAYLALLKGEEFPKGIDSKIPEAYQFFYKEIGNRIKAETIDPERLFIVLVNSLQVVFIDLDQGERPYEIFESLNAKGKPLSQADLVRNYIAMKLPENRQADIFNKHWSKIETILQEKRNVGKSSIGELTAFLRHYLTMRNGVLCNQAHVYERFRDRIENESSSIDEFEQEIATLKNYAEHYNRLLRPENEPDVELKRKLIRLNILEISTAYPFLMAAYESYSQKNLSHEEFAEVLEILENYIVRRYLTNDPTNYLNKMFPTLWREVSPTKLAETLKKVIITKNYPADSRVRREVLTEQIYDKRIQTSNKIVLVLDTINRFLSVKSGGYTVLDNTPTIEHILPQTPSSEWKTYLGANWEEVYTENLHTLGNLTLVTQEWNSKLSNSSFENKKNILASHALTLNNEYFKRKIVMWDEKAIQDRANFLVDAVLEYWPELGTPPITQKSAGTKPKSLTIMGQSFVVTSWRDVAFYTAQVISELVDDFDTRIAGQLQSYFDKQEYKSACRRLPNGWWLYMNLSAVNVKSLCRNMILLAEISEEDWQVEEE